MSKASSQLQKMPCDGGISYTELGHGVLLIWLDRPDKLNALEMEFWPSLRKVLRDHEQDGRVVVITGSGERAFSAGGDISSFQKLETEDAAAAFQKECMETFAAIEKHPVPVLAAVNGIAAGGGCELTMACDIVLASETATFSLPEATLGLVPGYGIIRASSIIGRQWLNLLVMNGEWIDANKAAQIGLVQKVISPNLLLDEAIGLAEAIAQMPREAIATAKKLAGSTTPQARIEESIASITLLHTTVEARERRRDFIKRRKNRS